MLPLAAALALAPAIQAPLARPLPLSDRMSGRIFPFAAAIDADPAASRALASDPVLRRLAQAKRQALSEAARRLNYGSWESIGAMKFTREEIQEAGSSLAAWGRTPQGARLARTLREWGALQRWSTLSDPDLLRRGWEVTAEGVNFIVDVYGLQNRPARSASIDGCIYTTKNELYGALLKTTATAADVLMPQEAPFYGPSIDTAVRLLRSQARDEAGRYEPLEQTANLAPSQRVKKTRFQDYPCSFILVPGWGPEEHEISLSPVARLHLEVAARRWKEKKAPFILVSGGHVHPNRTPFCEAFQMKNALVSSFGIPAEAVFVDPHARHTTTNVRNAARIAFRAGIPLDRPVLVCTNPYQSQDIEAPAFALRCQRELGYPTCSGFVRRSPMDLEMRLTLDSLTVDPLDPLDP